MRYPAWPVSCVYLLICFRLADGVPFKKWGCHFRNKNYEMPIKDLFDVVYGEELQPMVFNGRREFKNFVTMSTNVIANVLEEIPFSNIGEFNDFYDAYKQAGKIDDVDTFKKLLQNFSIPYHPKEICYSNAIEIMERISRNVPRAEPHLYLCTADAYIHHTFLNRLSVLEDVPKYFTHQHFAGCMKITFRNRNGHIIFDGSNGIREAVVVWEKSQTITRNGLNEKVHLYYLQNSLYKKYIVSQYPGNLQVFYVDLPICSFLATHRLRLASTFRSVCRTDRTGHVFIAYYITLRPMTEKSKDKKKKFERKKYQGGSNSSFRSDSLIIENSFKWKDDAEAGFDSSTWNPKFTLAMYEKHKRREDKVKIPFKLFPNNLTKELKANYTLFMKIMQMPVLEKIILKNKEIALDTKYLTLLYNMGKWIDSERKKMFDEDMRKYQFRANYSRTGLFDSVVDKFENFMYNLKSRLRCLQILD